VRLIFVVGGPGPSVLGAGGGPGPRLRSVVDQPVGSVAPVGVVAVDVFGAFSHSATS